jgi:hypothetical protein
MRKEYERLGDITNPEWSSNKINYDGAFQLLGEQVTYLPARKFGVWCLSTMPTDLLLIYLPLFVHNLR